MNLTIREFRDADLEAIVDLINTADAVDQLDEATAVSEFRQVLYRPNFDPYRDALVVVDEDQNIVGHARLDLKNAPRQARFIAHTVVHPDWRHQPMERLLLERLWSRAQERRPTLGSKPVQFRTYCAANQEKRASFFESLGFRPVRYDLQMVCQPLDNLADPRFPPGMRVRPYARGRDDEAALALINAAFADVMDFAAATLEDLEHWLETPSFRDYLSYVAYDGEVLAGLCLCTESEARADLLGRREGTVDTLCVRREYRRRGLGLALLRKSLQAFKRAGLESAALGTDTQNPTEAIRLYQQAGFREAWLWVTYGKEIEPQTTLTQEPQ
jgi:mycothiol synthase